MAQFTAEQREYIESTINIAIGKMEEKVGSILVQGEAMQKTLQGIVEKHNAELHASADRVTGLVDKANAANEKLEGSTARIDDSDAKTKKAEQIVTDLMEKLRVFEENQTASSRATRRSSRSSARPPRPPCRASTPSSATLSQAPALTPRPSSTQ